jgi:hypothetical protein
VDEFEPNGYRRVGAALPIAKCARFSSGWIASDRRFRHTNGGSIAI